MKSLGAEVRDETKAGAVRQGRQLQSTSPETMKHNRTDVFGPNQTPGGQTSLTFAAKPRKKMSAEKYE
jgi:hypothetical protein